MKIFFILLLQVLFFSCTGQKQGFDTSWVIDHSTDVPAQWEVMFELVGHDTAVYVSADGMFPLAQGFHWKQIFGQPTVIDYADNPICSIKGLSVGLYYFTITGDYSNGSRTDTVGLAVTNFNKYNVTIINTIISTTWFTDKLYWTSINEGKVDHYLIEKLDNGVYTKVGTIPAMSTMGTIPNSYDYKYPISRPWFSKRPKYKMTPVYKDGGMLGNAPVSL